MGLPVEINNLMLGSLGGYTVGRSLRFRSSASAYLNRTPASASNRKTWTWSGWVKRGTLGVNQHIFGGWDGSNNATGIYFATNDTIEVFSIQVSPTTYSLQLDTTQVFRDPSAWYHFVLAIDTTQATASNRAKLYVNGVQITALSTASYPSQNSDLFVNTNAGQFLCRMSWSAASYLDGYLAEVNFIDGQALTPSSFGAYDTNGVWQPKKYSGTYGTNGFYLPFSNTTSTTTLVQDSSGNGNNWTPNNISLTAGTTYDSMIDSPTNSASSSNYCVVSPLAYRTTTPTPTISNGNLTVVCPSASASSIGSSTFGVSSGKWYWEVTKTGTSYANVGVALAPFSQTVSSIYDFGYASNEYAYVNNGNKYNNNTASAYGATYTNNDIIGVALDLDVGTLTFYKNNASQGTAYSGLSSGTYIVGCYDSYNGSGFEFNFGQRPFSYTPPSGYKALNTYNLPAPSIANGSQYMAATTYTGTGATQSISNAVNGVSFQPDFVWMKTRSATAYHWLTDSVRGITNYLSSNDTIADQSASDAVTALNSNGFTLGANTSGTYTGAGMNYNGRTFIGWQWKGGGTGVTNNSGTITSTVSANTTAGFSVATFTTPSSFTNATVGHGLGVSPSMIIEFLRNASGDTHWVWHKSLSSTQYLQLQTTAAVATNSAIYNGVSSTTFTLGSNTAWGSGNYVAYCFAEVRGYSAFGSYSANGSTDGPFIYTGFRPRFILSKRTDSSTGGNWQIEDTSRATYNVVGPFLRADTSDAEGSGTLLDILSNGFKIRTTDTGWNASGGTYIYACFSEHPFNYSRAR